MVARVVPNSVSMVAQTAPPTSVTVHAGRNRRFFLMRFGLGTSSGVTDLTLGGQAHDTKDFRAASSQNIGTYWWDESTLQTAGVGINAAGALAIAGFVESGITEYIWCWGTVENATQGVTPGIGTFNDVTDAGSYTFPSTAITPSDLAPDYILMPSIILPATVGITDIEDSILVKELAQTSYKARLHETIHGSLEQWSVTLDADYDEVFAETLQLGAADPKVSAPELPVHAVQTRTMDAKTIADRYNLGVAKQEDYIFNDRKFYQDGSSS